MTIGEALEHPSPPVAVLERIKGFAKSARRPAGGVLPMEVATVLYYAAIAAARVRAGQWITSLEPQAVKAGAEWGLGLPWLDPAIRGLFEQVCREED